MIFIAEIGMNHNGNFSLAYELIKQAKLAGADIAKFQLGWRDKPGEINQIDRPVLDKLLKWCEYLEIEFMASIISDAAWAMVEDIDFQCYKIASRTVVENPDLVEKILLRGKTTYVSLGFWTGEGVPFSSASNIKYLWCKSAYPAEPWDIIDMPKNFDETEYSGYSDHTIGIDAAILAITRGAKIIEKHFTLDKSDTTIRDHALSATPDEFATMSQLGRDIYKKLSLGV